MDTEASNTHAVKAIFKLAVTANVSNTTAQDFLERGITNPSVVGGLRVAKLAGVVQVRVATAAEERDWDRETVAACASWLRNFRATQRIRALTWALCHDDEELKDVFQLHPSYKSELSELTKFVDALGVDCAADWWRFCQSASVVRTLSDAGIEPDRYRRDSLVSRYILGMDLRAINLSLSTEQIEKLYQTRSNGDSILTGMEAGWSFQQSVRLVEMIAQDYPVLSGLAYVTPTPRVIRQFDKPDAVLIPVLYGCDLRMARKWAKYAEGRRYTRAEVLSMRHGYGPGDEEFCALNSQELGKADFDVDQAREWAAIDIAVSDVRYVRYVLDRLGMTGSQKNVLDFLTNGGFSTDLERWNDMGFTSLRSILPYVRRGLTPRDLTMAESLGLSWNEALALTA